MRVIIADPPAFTPPYDHELASALARAGADVELVTSRFRFGPVPDPDGYVRDNLVGTTEQVTEKVQAFVDAGCAEFVLWFRDFPDTDSLERFMAEVVPAVSR